MADRTPTCESCGEPFQRCGYDEFECVCSCLNICPDHGLEPVYISPVDDGVRGGIWGYLCPACHPESFARVKAELDRRVARDGERTRATWSWNLGLTARPNYPVDISHPPKAA